MDASSWFTQTCTMQVQTGLGSSGSRQIEWGSQTTFRARVTPQNEMVENANGEMVKAQHLIRTDQPVDIHARIWLPGASTSDPQQARQPIRVRSTTAKGGGYTLYRIDL